MKRFWREATVAEQDGRFAIRLDGRAMHLPGGAVLRLARRGLAEAVAAEWNRVGTEVDWNDLKLTRLAGTAQERIAPDPAPTAAAIARYAESDALCYRADQPQALVARQHAAWQPWLDWAAETFGARLTVTAGLMPVTQPPGAVAALRDATASRDPFELAGLGILVPVYGSLVLGLAVAAGRLTATAAYDLSILDDLFQEEFWGEDRDALARRALLRRDVEDAARFMALALA